MAAEMIVAPRAESHTLLAEEERVRRHLEEHLAVRTRSAPLPDVRALLVSPADEGAKTLVVASDASAAERIYLYVHVAAHLALGHHLPLVTIVEGAPGIGRLDGDAHRHLEAERLARAIWWGRNDDLAAPLSVRGSALLRELVSRGVTRTALRSVLLALRAAYYDLRIERALARTPLAVWLRDALCVTAVIAVAPQLSD
jgi:hypothetical protein